MLTRDLDFLELRSCAPNTDLISVSAFKPSAALATSSFGLFFSFGFNLHLIRADSSARRMKSTFTDPQHLIWLNLGDEMHDIDCEDDDCKDPRCIKGRHECEPLLQKWQESRRELTFATSSMGFRP